MKRPFDLVREQAAEGWDYFISDELVYVAEIPKGERERVGRGKGYINDYIERHLWFELVALLGGDDEEVCVGLIEACPPGIFLPAEQGERRFSEDRRDNPMFVFIDKSAHDAEHFEFRPVRSVVWLKALHNRVATRRPEGKIVGVQAADHGVLLYRRPSQWERDAALLSVSELRPARQHESGHGPSDVIERGAQVREDVADDQSPPPIEGRIKGQRVDGLSRLYRDFWDTWKVQFAIGDEGELWIARGRADGDLEATYVYVRPLSFELGAAEWVIEGIDSGHDVPSNTNRESGR